MTLLLLACTAADPDNPADSGLVEADADTDADTDTDTDTDVEPVDCLPDFGMASGAQWVYSWRNSSRTGNYIVDAIGFSADDQTATLRAESAWSDAGGAATFTGTKDTHYWCDAQGLYVTGFSYSYSGQTSGNAYSGDYSVAYDEPALLVPLVIAEGGSWITTFVGTKTEDGYDSDIDSTSTSEVMATGVVWSGGHASSEIKITDDATGNFTTFWWGDGVGLVADISVQLVSYSE